MTQVEHLYQILRDGKPHRSDNLVRQVYGGEFGLARLGARIFDVKMMVCVCPWKDDHEIDCVCLISYKAPEKKTLQYYQLKIYSPSERPDTSAESALSQVKEPPRSLAQGVFYCECGNALEKKSLDPTFQYCRKCDDFLDTRKIA